MKNYRYFPEFYRYLIFSGDFIWGLYPGALSGDFIRGLYPGTLAYPDEVSILVYIATHVQIELMGSHSPG
jgi:hypothetical protein